MSAEPSAFEPVIPPADQSSANGLIRVPRHSFVVIELSPTFEDPGEPSPTLEDPGTSAATRGRLWEEPYMPEPESTGSGVGSDPMEREQPVKPGSSEVTKRAIAELRRISGLTWEQLGQLFDVSRRSLHFWASGRPLNAKNEARVLRVLEIVREADRGDGRSTRGALFQGTAGRTPFDLLASQRFDEARALLGSGPGRRQPAKTALSDQEIHARTPPGPDARVEVEQEPVHRDVGRGRGVRSVRRRRRGGSR